MNSKSKISALIPIDAGQYIKTENKQLIIQIPRINNKYYSQEKCTIEA